MIHLEGISKRFGSFYAVKDLSLHVAPGEVFGFLGPNGAGKTTTMKMLVGLIRPTAGKVAVDGIDVVADPIRARQIIGYIPDRPYLYEKLTAREFLTFTAGIYGMEVRAQAKRADELLELFGLGQWAGELIETYSHGMKQRLTMAAAVLHRPRLLVVDEPMVGLDPWGARLVKQVFRDLCDDDDLAVLLSTHTLDVAEEVCDRIAIIHRSKIVAIGTMDELRVEADRPGSDLEEIFLRITEKKGEFTPFGDRDSDA